MNISYKFLDLRTLEFAYFDENLNGDEGRMEIKTSFGYGVDASTHRLSCMLEVMYSIEDRPVMKIKTGATYELDAESFGSFVKGETFEMPVEPVRHFSSMLYGATRGILSCKLEGTRLQQMILPPRNLDTTIAEPLHIARRE